MQVAEQGPPGATRLESHATRSILPDATEKLLKAGPPGHTTQKLARRARRLPKVYAIPNHTARVKAGRTRRKERIETPDSADEETEPRQATEGHARNSGGPGAWTRVPEPYSHAPGTWSSAATGHGEPVGQEGRNEKTKAPTGARRRLRASAGATPRGGLGKSGVPGPRNRPQESEEPSTLASPRSRPWVLLGGPERYWWVPVGWGPTPHGLMGKTGKWGGEKLTRQLEK